MRWKLFADLAETAGPGEVTVGDDHDTVAEALDALLETHPELRDRVLADGEVRRDVNVLRNGENVRNADGLETPVDAGDELALMPPVTGG